MTGNTAYLLYFVFALGAVAVHALLPQRKPAARWFGVTIGVCALLGLVAVLAWRIAVPDSTNAYFYLFSILAIASAARVITHSRPVYSALYFILTIVAVASLLVLLQAEFLAIATIIIYAGAILVTYLFVIMLAQQSGAPAYDRHAREPMASVLAGFVLMAAIAGRVGEINPVSTSASALTSAVVKEPGSETAPREGNSIALGWVLMGKHIVATELAAVLLLISMVGAIAMSKKRMVMEDGAAPGPELGQVGREVKPF